MVDVDKAVIARLKSHGSVYEILVDCDAAIKFRESQSIPIEDVLAVDKIFSDAKKGLAASDTQMEHIFGSSEPAEVAKRIIQKGEIQITSDHRAKYRDQKKKKILEIIHRNGVDPKTNLPHPINRLELAFEEAKIKIDENRGAEDQIGPIIKQLRPILPIRFESREIAIRIPALYSGKAYSAVAGFGKLKKEEWLGDGSWACIIEVPAGIQADLFDQLNKITQGNVETKILKSEQGDY